MRWFLRVICLLVVLIAVLGLFGRSWLIRGKEAILGPVGNSAESTANQRDSTVADKPLSADAEFAAQPDDASSEFKNDLTRGLGEFIKSRDDVFGESGDDLYESLLAADELLAKTKRDNRQAIRQANRQPRVNNASSPNVVLITVAGLNRQQLGCYNGESDATPSMDAIARRGGQAQQIELSAAGGAADALELLSGRRGTASQEPAQLKPAETWLQTLWQAGYSTALIGDCSPLALDQTADDVLDEWLGYRSTAEAAEAFPEQIWSNGRRIKLLDNADGKRGLPAQSLFAAEAAAYLDRHRRGRPFALQIAFTLHSAEESADTAIRNLDQDIGKLAAELDRLGLSGNTLLLIVGCNGEARVGPLIAQWPGRIKQASLAASASRLIDVAPTLAEAVGAWRKPRHVDGDSLISSWQN